MTETQYATLREKIAAEKAERLARYAEFERVYQLAHTAGNEAALAAIPTPMLVIEHVNPLDDSSPVKRVYEPVTEGACGFAWVNVYPGNCSFAIWAKKNHGWSPKYKGGMQMWVGGYGQSVTRKEAYAQAFVHVLRDNFPEIQVYAGSRLD